VQAYLWLQFCDMPTGERRRRSVFSAISNLQDPGISLGRRDRANALFRRD
jgi:hypothetical protein